MAGPEERGWLPNPSVSEGELISPERPGRNACLEHLREPLGRPADVAPIAEPPVLLEQDDEPPLPAERADPRQVRRPVVEFDEEGRGVELDVLPDDEDDPGQR